MPLVVGVDSSTQATKVEIRDADTGALVGAGRAPHPPVHPPRSEQDPEAWWQALQAAVAAALTDATRPGWVVGAIGAISVAGQQHGMVVLDAEGEVIRPAKLWNDTESAPDADWLVGRLDGPQAWAEACGSVPVASFTITKLSWLHRCEPDAWARLARVLLPHDWLTFRLTGEYVTDRGDASGTGYWSAPDEGYRYDLLAVVDDGRDWSTALPTVLGPTELAGALGASAADHLGLRPGIPVTAGTGDNMAAALGIALDPGDVAVSIGTSGTVYATSTTPTADPTGAVAGFADATGRFLPLVCTLNAAKVTDAVARLLGVDADAFDDLALGAPPGADDLVLVPYLDGERTPNRPDATGTLLGLRSDVRREAFARAAVEGVVCGLLEALDALVAAGADPRGRLLLVGGGSRSAAYRRVVADLAGRTVTVPSGHEHVATGACVQAAAALTGAEPLTVARAWATAPHLVIDPDPAVDADAVRAAFATARG